MTFPFSTLVKSSAARGRFNSLLEINFYRETHQAKCCKYNNKDKDHRPNTLNDKNSKECYCLHRFIYTATSAYQYFRKFQ